MSFYEYKDSFLNLDNNHHLYFFSSLLVTSLISEWFNSTFFFFSAISRFNSLRGSIIRKLFSHHIYSTTVRHVRVRKICSISSTRSEHSTHIYSVRIFKWNEIILFFFSSFKVSFEWWWGSGRRSHSLISTKHEKRGEGSRFSDF